MGVLGSSFGLPLMGPLRGLTWLAQQIADAASREMVDPARIEAELLALERELESGKIDEATYETQEAALLEQLQAAQVLRTPPDEPPA